MVHSVSSNTIVLVFSASPGVHAWVGEVALVLEPHFMGLSLMPSGKTWLKHLCQSLLKEACDPIAFSSPGVNAWAREITL